MSNRTEPTPPIASPFVGAAPPAAARARRGPRGWIVVAGVLAIAGVVGVVLATGMVVRSTGGPRDGEPEPSGRAIALATRARELGSAAPSASLHDLPAQLPAGAAIHLVTDRGEGVGRAADVLYRCEHPRIAKPDAVRRCASATHALVVREHSEACFPGPRGCRRCRLSAYLFDLDTGALLGGFASEGSGVGTTKRSYCEARRDELVEDVAQRLGATLVE